jgi:large subunit ribosomal protein L24
MHIKKDDVVVVITGKDKGKRGKVLRALPKKGKVIVEGINVQTKHQKQTRTERSDIKHIEGPVDASNVMLWDSKAKSGTRVGHKIEGGEKIRYSKKTGIEID